MIYNKIVTMENQKLNLKSKNSRISRRHDEQLKREGKTEKRYPIYPQEMIDDEISIISMDTTTTMNHSDNKIKHTKQRESRIPNKFDSRVLYAKNLELNSRVEHYSQALCELTAEYERVKKENETLYKKLDDNNKNIGFIDSLFKIKQINDKYRYNLPLLNPRDNRRFVVDQIRQIIDNKAILTECREASIDGFAVGDIVLLDITNCYSKKIIHKFSESEKYVIVNLPHEEYRKANPGYPMEQITDWKSLSMIKDLYKLFIRN